MSQENPTNEQGNNDALIMSDEDFSQLDPSTFDQEYEAEPDDASFNDDGDDEAPDTDETDDADTGAEDTDTEDSDDEEDDDATAEADDSEDEDSDDQDETDSEDDLEEDSEDTDEDKETDKKDESEDDDSKVDFEAEYKKLLAPFKANGHEIQVKNADEAVRLMQMGANYNKKMAALKPSLKTVKLLDKHGLNDEQKLGHLLDVSRGDKGAIQKLLKDQGIDPLDFDAAEESDYRPNTYTVDDRELALDEVLDNLKESPNYTQLTDVVSTKWDDASRQIIANNPRVLEDLNSQMANGVFDRISTEVERLRAFGQLAEVSTIEAYKAVGEQMEARGDFKDLFNKGQGAENTTDKEPPVRRVVKKEPDPKLKQKKRAASPNKTKPASTAPADFNPLGMSDDEFEKQFDSNLM